MSSYSFYKLSKFTKIITRAFDTKLHFFNKFKYRDLPQNNFQNKQQALSENYKTLRTDNSYLQKLANGLSSEKVLGLNTINLFNMFYAVLYSMLTKM